MQKKMYSAVASLLSIMAVGFVSVASLFFVYSPEIPEDLKSKED